MDFKLFLFASRHMPERTIIQEIANATLAWSRKPNEDNLLTLKSYCHLLLMKGIQENRTDADIEAEFEQIKNIKQMFNKN